MHIAQLSTGFIDLPGITTLNVFAQGCRHDCPGCSNVALQPFSSPLSYELTDGIFINELEKCHPLMNWVCWLGGDALYQPSRFIQLAQIASQHQYHNCIYTGFEFASDEVQRTLEHVDIVVDGPWRGVPITNDVSNQKIFVKDPVTKQFNQVKWSKLNDEIRQKY